MLTFRLVQFELRLWSARNELPVCDSLAVSGRKVPLQFVRHRGARRYVLRLAPEGIARVTIPRGGSVAEGKRFAERNLVWLERQLLHRALTAAPKAWLPGTEILFRGQHVRLEAGPNGEPGVLRFADQTVRINSEESDFRPAIERHLWRLGKRELPRCVFEMAQRHQFVVQRVTVRNQRSRWGSCSRKGAISLNWRLVQAPEFVRDYIVLHELAHLREMNHSRRFWREVARLCPHFEEAERWLKQNAVLLR